MYYCRVGNTDVGKMYTIVLMATNGDEVKTPQDIKNLYPTDNLYYRVQFTTQGCE